ncbi:MAG TPA: GtrA family protein [Arenimonas sp.]|nr:GtrA family protein [Arenimonas sp.]
MQRSHLSRQLLLFLLVGGVQVLLDTTIFIATTALGAPVAAANLLGRVSGAALGYWLNGRYTFATGGSHALGRRALQRFIIAWLALTALSTVMLAAIAHQASLSWAWIAKPAVEALIAGLGFLVWRHWVYR